MSKRNAEAAANFYLALQTLEGELTGAMSNSPIPADMGLRAWCDVISRDREDPKTGRMLPGLRVDGVPFSLADRPAMAWIYDQVPMTREQAEDRHLILMKCAQVGFTVMEVLAAIYMAMKFAPLRVGCFLPDMGLTHSKSRDRFLPIIRSIPEAYALLTAPQPGELKPRRSEGTLTTRRLGSSILHFLWTSGKGTTESKPMDVVCFDEVQEMSIAAMEKVIVRLGASKVKFVLMGSTANHPGGDIHYWYQKGSQWRFHTRCPVCGAEEPLDEYFPACIGFDPEAAHPKTGALGVYRYRCRAGHWIDDPQQGAWIADNPEADRRFKSIHFHQMLSPTVSPEEIYLAYLNGHDVTNFYNRRLGKPYQDPNELPVTDAVLAACVAEGNKAGVFWRKEAKRTFMGVDQMGEFICVVIMERRDDGRHAVIHVEEIYGENTFDRCSELMAQYGVQVCVIEQLPNIDNARAFARKHAGRVFIATKYCEIDEGVARWGDAKMTRSELRTVEEQRDRHIVHIDRHKAMSLALHRIALTGTLFPDPQELVQQVREKSAVFDAPVLKDRVFPHLKSTALVTKRVNDLELRFRRTVEKRGKDPHFAFAFMLCEVAMVRADSTSMFLIPDPADVEFPTTPEQLPVMQAIRHPMVRGTCSACVNFKRSEGEAGDRGQGVCVTTILGGFPIGTTAKDPATVTCGYSPRSG